MSKTYLRLSKKLKVLNDGSSVYKYDNGCKNSLSLFNKDISCTSPWVKNQDSTSLIKDTSNLGGYKKKFIKKS